MDTSHGGDEAKVLWERQGTHPGAKEFAIRALPALLMLVLGFEALRIALVNLILGPTLAQFLFVLPVRELDTLSALGAVLLAGIALAQGLQVVWHQLWKGFACRVVLCDGILAIYGDGIHSLLRKGKVPAPAWMLSCEGVKRMEVVARRRSEYSYELRAWGTKGLSRLVATADTSRELETLMELLRPEH